MSATCLNRVCPYCEEIVRGVIREDRTIECCGEIHNYECGDEGRAKCPDCFEKDRAKWASYFGLNGLNQTQRIDALERFRPLGTICPRCEREGHPGECES